MKNATLNDYKARILRVMVHIERNLDTSLPLAELARVACFSPFHFHRIFRGMTGESVAEYVRRLRMERAARQLRTGKETILAVALEAGFESHEAFTRSFRSVFGQTPSCFRQAFPDPRAEAPSGVHYREPPSRRFRTQSRGGRMKAEIKKMQPMRVAYLRHVGPYNEVGPTWDRLTMLLGKEGYLAGNPMILGLCHDDPEVTEPAKIRYDACVTVDESFEPIEGIEVQTIAGGDYAVTLHKGSFDGLGRTYAELYGQWIPRAGREVRNAPAFEVYLCNPDETPEEERLTEIYAPLEEVAQ
ncbi:MAG: AraC family transcriptional regulator [Terracidiphilus sp.]